MLRTAVVGIGNMGKHHGRIYYELPDTELVAVCDINKELGKDFASRHNCKYYEDYNEMIKKEKLDAVSIVVPTSFHKKVALEFINKKINVLIEKPISSTVEEAKELIDAAKKNNVKLLVGHIERHNPAVLKLKEMIDNGVLGELISIDAKRVGGYPPQIKDSDVILDVAIHDVDILNFLYKKFPNEVFSTKGVAIGKNKADYVDILLDYSGKSGSVQCNWITPVKIRTLAVTGTKAYAELNYMTQEIKLFESDVVKTVDNFGDFIIKFGNPDMKNVEIKKEEPLKLEILNFINSINGDEKLKITPEEAMKALELVLKISRKGA